MLEIHEIRSFSINSSLDIVHTTNNTGIGIYMDV